MSARAVPTARIRGPNRPSWRGVSVVRGHPQHFLCVECMPAVVRSRVAGGSGGAVDLGRRGQARAGSAFGWRRSTVVIARGTFITHGRVIGAVVTACVIHSARRAIAAGERRCRVRDACYARMRSPFCARDPGVSTGGYSLPRHSPSRARFSLGESGPRPPVHLSCGSDEHPARDSAVCFFCPTRRRRDISRRMRDALIARVSRSVPAGPSAPDRPNSETHAGTGALRADSHGQRRLPVHSDPCGPTGVAVLVGWGGGGGVIQQHADE